MTMNNSSIDSPVTANHFDNDDLSTRFYNQPLMVCDADARFLRAQAGRRMVRPTASDGNMLHPATYAQSGVKPYVVSDGVAVIHIKGSLEHDSYWYTAYWTGYDAIRARFDMALEDPDVRGIAFFIGSGGGMVSGNFDLVDHIYQKRGVKPMIAIVDEHAYSAAYSLASAADKIVVARTGGVGSVGALMVHYDYSAALKNAGITAKILRAGELKAKPNMLEPLDEEVTAIEIDRLENVRTLFIDTVARNRDIDADVVRNTKAATFAAVDAITIGLADAIEAPNVALAAFKKELAGSKTLGATNMSTNDEATFTQSQMNDAIAKAQETASSDKAAAVAAERDRIFAVIGCEAAVGREQAALTLAKNPAMGADAATELLESFPKAAVASNDTLSSVMSEIGGGANVSQDSDAEDSGEGEKEVSIDTHAIYERMNNPK